MWLMVWGALTEGILAKDPPNQRWGDWPSSKCPVGGFWKCQHPSFGIAWLLGATPSRPGLG